MLLLHWSDAQLDLALRLIEEADERFTEMRIQRAAILSEGWPI